MLRQQNERTPGAAENSDPAGPRAADAVPDGEPSLSAAAGLPGGEPLPGEEHRLAGEQHRLRLVLDALPALISYVDAQQRYQFLNAAYHDWFGKGTTTHIGRHLWEVLGQAAYDKIRPHVEAVLAGERRTFEAEVPYQSGGCRFIRAQYVPEFNQRGETIGYFALITDLTESRQKAAQLQALEQRFYATFEQAVVGIAHLQPDGRWLRVNQKLCSMLGYDREELLGQWFQDVASNDDWQSACGPLHQLLSGKIPGYSLELRLVRKDGERMWCTLTISQASTDPDNSYLVAVVKDISRRKQAEQALRSEHAFREQLIETAQAVILVLDAQGRIVRFNHYLQSLSGYSLSEVQGKDWFETFIPAHDRPRIEQVFTASLAGTATRGNVNPILTKDGRERLIQWHDTMLTGDDGEVTHILATGHDITDRCRTEQALRESEARLQAILDTAADAVVSMDRAGIIQSFNPAAERIFGYRAAEATGKNIRRFIPDASCGEWEGDGGDALGFAQTAGFGVQRERVAVRRNGESFPIELSVGEINQLDAFVVIIRDISTRRRSEREISEAVAREQRRIGHDLHDGVGQELTGLRFMAQCLADDIAEKDSATRQLAERFLDSLANAHRQVRQLSQGLAPVELDAEGLLVALRELAKRTAALPELRCEFRCAQSASLLDNFRATHLYRIAQEAVTNAVRHSHAKQIVISFQEAAGQAHLTVDDDGIGIDSAASRGDGMGLRIMASRAHQIGAQLHFETTRENGTRLTCRVPLQENDRAWLSPAEGI